MTFDQRLARYLGSAPKIHASAFIAPSADICGDVTIGPDASIWYGTVLRGDINRIEVGEASNIQDGSVVHLADDFPSIVGARVTIGHRAMIHACTIEDECLIGMSSTILDGAVVGKGSIVGAGALVTRRMIIPPGSLVLGAPAKVVRAVTEQERELIRGLAEKYIAVARAHKARLAP
ncbi:MAG TPA: gamma carbonic anhydrase family protein [Verrucomicrobiae bacterium]|nr:gamma carbonic anhydrase family protein [Verrucomicrobiae bacterium]